MISNFCHITTVHPFDEQVAVQAAQVLRATGYGVLMEKGELRVRGPLDRSRRQVELVLRERFHTVQEYDGLTRKFIGYKIY